VALPRLSARDRGERSEDVSRDARLETTFSGLEVDELPVPADCSDGFCVALWNRPEAHLDPLVRRASSVWPLLAAAVVNRGLDRLRRDLGSGAWDRRYGELRALGSLDVGLRLVRARV
jgi:hypothetical protein